MTRPAVRGLAWFLCTALALSACGGGGGGRGEEIHWVVMPRPDSFRDGSDNDQPPPDDVLEPWFTLRTPIEPVPLDRAARDALEAEALALARTHLVATGYPDTTDVAVRLFLQDEWGGVHVKMDQTHFGVPVIGAGVVAHLHPDVPDDVTDALVAGIDVDTEPRVAQSVAESIALARYPDRAAVVTASTRLAILPTRDLVRVRFAHAEENREDFDRVLAGVHLVWEVTVAPAKPDVPAIVAAKLAATPVNKDVDDSMLELLRIQNVQRSGHEIPVVAAESFTSVGLAPGVRTRIDAATGDVLSERVLIEQDGFEEEEGTGWGYFTGKVPLDTSSYPNTDLNWLIDVNRPKLEGDPGVGNIVWDAKNLETHDPDNMSLFVDATNTWGDCALEGTATALPTSTRRQTPAVDVYHSMQMTWDLFRNVLSRWGLDNQGTRLDAAVHWGDGYKDAHYNNSSNFVVFGDGVTDGSPGNYPIDTVAHELGHWFWHASGNGSEAGESSALNEGHGDIQGSLVRLYRGTGNGLGSQVRRFPNFSDWKARLRDPDGYSEKVGDDTFIGLKYWSSSLKDGPEHVGGIPFGRAFIYLAEGAPSDPADTLWTTEYPAGLGGIGHTKAAHIWKTAIAYYLGGTPDYGSVYEAFLQAAQYLYGQDSMEFRATRRAFAAIRVGTGPGDTTDPDITYAKVFSVDTKDMTALVYAEVNENAGLSSMKVVGSGNDGYYEGADYFYGYFSILRSPIGTRSAQFQVTDGVGRTDTANRNYLKPRDHNLIQNGDFEDGTDGWSNDNDVAFVADDRTRAFLGRRYLYMKGEGTAYQQVAIPAAAKKATLVFRLLVRDTTTSEETMEAKVLSDDGTVVRQILGAYDWDTPEDARTYGNKGYLRQEFDLTAYAGETIRVAFANHTPDDATRFLIDQVVLTYEQEVTLDPPDVHLFPWENTVAFTVDSLAGVSNAEVARIDYWVDGHYQTASTSPSFHWYQGAYLDDLGPGPHWVGALVRGLDNKVLGQSVGVWFEPGPVHELLANKGFESGAWDLTYSDPPPKVVVVQNDFNGTIAYDGQKALRLGGQGAAGTAQAGQALHVPNQIKTLDFSVRVRVFTDEPGGPTLVNDDELRLEIWNANTFTKIGEYLLAGHYSNFTTVGSHDAFANYWRSNLSLPTAPYAGKDVIVILKAKENAALQTTFYVDNASLRYSQLGLQFN